jgi:hypothetical protein
VQGYDVENAAGWRAACSRLSCISEIEQ